MINICPHHDRHDDDPLCIWSFAAVQRQISGSGRRDGGSVELLTKLETASTAATQRLADVDDGTEDRDGEDSDGDPEDEVGVKDDEAVEGWVGGE